MNEPIAIGQHQPPALVNEEAEYFVLGAMMHDNRLVPAVVEILTADQFYFGIHAKIFRAIAKLTERGMIANPVTLRPFFDFDPEVAELLPNQAIGSYLAQALGSGSILIGALDMARQVADLASLRKVDDALGKHRTLLPSNLDDSVEEIVDRIESDLWSALGSRPVIASNSAADMVNRVLERNQRIALDEVTAGSRNALVQDVDKLIGESEGGNYTIIGGRTGQGKSTTARSTALGYAINGDPVEYYYTEMSEEQMAIAVVSDITLMLGKPIEMKDLRKGNLTAAQLATLERANQMVATLPINFVKVGRCDVSRVESLATRAKTRWAAKGKPNLKIFVDYLQHLQVSRNGRQVHDATERVAFVSGRLLDLAHKLFAHVFALCQLNRGVEDAKDPRPRAHHLKQAGELEQDADSIILVFREEEYLKLQQPKQGAPNYERDYDRWRTDFDAVRGKIELICDKNRHGEKSTRLVKFYGQYGGIRGSDFDEFAPADDLGFDFGGEI